MRDLIVRVLNEFKWKDGPNGGEPDLPPRRSGRQGQLYPVKGQYADEQEHHYDTEAGRWHIRRDGNPVGGWSYCHEDYDGDGDPRHGFGNSAEDCADAIDELHPETHEKEP